MERLNLLGFFVEDDMCGIVKKNCEVIIEWWWVELIFLLDMLMEDFGFFFLIIYKKVIVFFRLLFVIMWLLLVWKFVSLGLLRNVNLVLILCC